MGQITVKLSVYPTNGADAREVDALVDTGAAYSMLPRPFLESLGYRPVRPQRVVLADGRIEEWSMTLLDVAYDGRRVQTPVLMGPHASPTLLGATTLEELGLGIDPVNRRLTPIDVFLA